MHGDDGRRDAVFEINRSRLARFFMHPEGALAENLVGRTMRMLTLAKCQKRRRAGEPKALKTEFTQDSANPELLVGVAGEYNDKTGVFRESVSDNLFRGRSDLTGSSSIRVACRG